MRIIKITTENEILICEKDTDYTREDLEQLLNCEYVENVMPKRLYNELGIPKIDAVMLVDEDGRLHCRKINLVGSWLYETDIHGIPIVGDVLITGFLRDKADICGLGEKMFNELYPKLEKMARDFNHRRMS